MLKQFCSKIVCTYINKFCDGIQVVFVMERICITDVCMEPFDFVQTVTVSDLPEASQTKWCF